MSVVEFQSTGRQRRALRRVRTQGRRLVFRSYALIVGSDDADLIRDVSLDVDKAQTKLRLVQQRLKGLWEQAAAQLEMLSEAETKLAAAIVAALLSGQRKRNEG